MQKRPETASFILASMCLGLHLLLLSAQLTDVFSCSSGFYGPHCNLSCAEHCDRGGCINSMNGGCVLGCGKGWHQSPMCNKKCPKDRFYFNCSRTCYCNDTSEVCDVKNGNCNSGCHPDWFDLGCSVRLPVLTSPPLLAGHNCSHLSVTFRQFNPIVDIGADAVGEYYLQIAVNGSEEGGWTNRFIVPKDGPFKVMIGGSLDASRFYRVRMRILYKNGFIEKLGPASNSSEPVQLNCFPKTTITGVTQATTTQTETPPLTFTTEAEKRSSGTPRETAPVSTEQPTSLPPETTTIFSCSSGLYGPHCNLSCAEHCDRGGCINSMNGGCVLGCGKGWHQSPMCNETCPKDRFYFNCSRTCYCNDTSEVCDVKNGNCNSGCHPDWFDLGCSVRLPVLTSPPLLAGHNCSHLSVTFRQFNPIVDIGADAVGEYYIQIAVNGSEEGGWTNRFIVPKDGPFKVMISGNLDASRFYQVRMRILYKNGSTEKLGPASKPSEPVQLNCVRKWR